MQRGSPEKKIPAQAVSEKKKIRAELKIPQPPPITFLMVRPLRKYFISPIFGMTLKLNDMLT